MQTVFMFSGQGSQYFQMGKTLFEASPVFRRHMLQLDEVVRRIIDYSVLDVLYAPSNSISHPFDRTLFSHPAILMVEYALAQTMAHEGIEPDVVLGASLGSFAAAAVACVLSIEDALIAVCAHAAALEQNCAPGAMMAVLADPALYDEDFLRLHSELAAVNFNGHFTVAAPLAACSAIETELAHRDIVYQRIPVSFAFHARWVDAARDGFLDQVSRLSYGQPSVSIMCCAQARTFGGWDGASFWDATRQPIRFPQAIAELEREGACRYIDLGPAGTLATFLKYLLPSSGASTAWPILTPYGRDLANWDAAIAA